MDTEKVDKLIFQTMDEIKNTDAIQLYYKNYFKIGIEDNFKKFDWNKIDLNQNLNNLYNLIDSSFIKPTYEDKVLNDDLTINLNNINTLILMNQLTNKMKDKIIEELCRNKRASY